MTSTTTIRLEDELKMRVAEAAARAGKTSHAFIRDAIVQTVEQAELDDALRHVADARWQKIAGGGETVAWSDAKKWLAATSQGETIPRPSSRRAAR
jgi:predicted transcriptional regulator